MSDVKSKGGLRRDAKAVSALLQKTSDRRIITKEKCYIQVPERYSQIDLAKIGVQTFVYGCFAIIFETGIYSLFHVNAMVEINPSRMKMVEIGGVSYHQFEFDAGTTVIQTIDLVKRDTIMFNVLDEFIFKGKIPWFMNYEDLGEIFSTAPKYAGSAVGKNADAVEFLAAMITRSKSDPSQQIRWNLTSLKDASRENLRFVPLSSVYYSVNNTVNKLAGNYFSDGKISALINPAKEPSRIETILRS